MDAPSFAIYLDQNKWIELARARHRSDASSDDKANLHSIEDAVVDGRVCFPVSYVHIMETARIGNQTQRLQLAELMAELSIGWYLAGRQTIVNQELDNALSALLEPEKPARRVAAFTRNLFLVFDDYGGQERGRVISSVLGPQEMLIDFLSFDDENVRLLAIQRMSKSNDELTSRIRKRRERTASETVEVRDRIYRASLFLEVQEKFTNSLQRIGRSWPELRKLPDSQMASILDRVPCWDVECTLTSQVERQKTRATEGNDVYDIGALASAIPYCDVVVTEKLWTHLCRVAGLPTKYKTRIVNSIREVAAMIP